MLVYESFHEMIQYTYMFQIVEALLHKYRKATSERILTHWEALALFGRTASHWWVMMDLCILITGWISFEQIFYQGDYRVDAI